MLKYIIILLLITCSAYAQVGIRDARVIGNMNVGTQYVIVNKQYVVSGFNIEKFYNNYTETISIAVSTIDQDAIRNNIVKKVAPYVAYTTSYEKIYFDYDDEKFYNFIQNKGYTEEEITFIKQLIELVLEW